MSARQFFSVLKAARKREAEKLGLFYYEMTNVACAGLGDVKWIESLQSGYRKRFDESARTKVFDNEVAGRILTSMLGGN